MVEDFNDLDAGIASVGQHLKNFLECLVCDEDSVEMGDDLKRLW